jgi:hypothetical protein
VLTIRSTLVQRASLRPLPLWIALAIAAVFPCPRANAQQGPEFAVQGYVTAVQSANHFDVDGKHVETSSATIWQVMDKAALVSGDWLPRTAAQVGAYLRVAGPTNRHTHIIHAEEISLRDDRDKKLSGIGVIDKVLEAGLQPTFRADGYLIRVTPATSISFNDEFKSIADIRPDTWVHYEGKRDRTGVLRATRVAFVHAKLSSHSAAGPSSPSPSGPVKGEDGAIRYTPINDAALQQRIQRIGIAVVPAYQKELPDDSPSKIHFRFVATDNEKYHWENCTSDGLILVPKLVVDRLTRDDQLAAVLADGVAFNLQRQAARVYGEGRLLDGIQNSGYFFLPVGLAAVAGSRAVERKMLYTMEEQRGRVALALMSDAGYDPWQSPEAWRLLAPKHMPADVNSLHYPENSGYLLNISSLQYSKVTAPSSAAATLQ